MGICIVTLEKCYLQLRAVVRSRLSVRCTHPTRVLHASFMDGALKYTRPSRTVHSRLSVALLHYTNICALSFLKIMINLHQISVDIVLEEDNMGLSPMFTI